MIQSYEDAPFLGQNDQTALNKIFLRKTINIISISLASLFVKNCKTILTTDPELWARAILGAKWSICPKQDFFGEKH